MVNIFFKLYLFLFYCIIYPLVKVFEDPTVGIIEDSTIAPKLDTVDLLCIRRWHTRYVVEDVTNIARVGGVVSAHVFTPCC